MFGFGKMFFKILPFTFVSICSFTSCFHCFYGSFSFSSNHEILAPLEISMNVNRLKRCPWWLLLMFFPRVPMFGIEGCGCFILRVVGLGWVVHLLLILPIRVKVFMWVFGSCVRLRNLSTIYCCIVL